MIPYSRPKLCDLYTLSQSELLENHTLHSGTYLYSPYMAVPPPPRDMYQVTVDINYPKYKKKMNSKCNWLLFHTRHPSLLTKSTLTSSWYPQLRVHSYYHMLIMRMISPSCRHCLFPPIFSGPNDSITTASFSYHSPTGLEPFFALFFTPYFYYIRLTLYLYF